MIGPRRIAIVIAVAAAAVGTIGSFSIVAADVIDFDDALYAHWKFDEAAGSLTPDSENSLDALLSATGTTVNPAGNIGGALDLSGNGSWGSVPSVTMGTEFTIAAWVNSTVAAQTGWARIVENAYGSGFYLGTNGSGANYQFIVNGNFDLAAGAVAQNTWQHLVATYDGANAVLYVDNVAGAPVGMVAPAEQAGEIGIGARPGQVSGPINEHWTGMLDDVRIYNRALTAGEVSDLHAFNGPGSPENPIANHSFENPGNGPGGFVIDVGPEVPYWNKFTAAANQAGNFNPTAAQFGGELADGDGSPNFAFIAGGSETGFSQDPVRFDGTPILYQQGTYTLTGALAGREDHLHLTAGAHFTLALQTIADDPITGTPLSSIVVSGDQIANTAFTDFSTLLTIPAGSPAIGQPMRVVVKSNGDAGDGHWTLDDVRLTLPEGDPIEYVELPDPAIIGHGSEHSIDYVAENVFDDDFSGNLGTEFSSVRFDTSFIDFDFGSTVTIDAFQFANRQPVPDWLETMTLTFSDDADFTGDPSVTIAVPQNGAFILYPIDRQQARFVRWEAGANPSGYRGGAEMAFFQVVPEPTGCFLAILAALGLIGSFARRR